MGQHLPRLERKIRWRCGCGKKGRCSKGHLANMWKNIEAQSIRLIFWITMRQWKKSRRMRESSNDQCKWRIQEVFGVRRQIEVLIEDQQLMKDGFLYRIPAKCPIDTIIAESKWRNWRKTVLGNHVCIRWIRVPRYKHQEMDIFTKHSYTGIETDKSVNLNAVCNLRAVLELLVRQDTRNEWTHLKLNKTFVKSNRRQMEGIAKLFPNVRKLEITETELQPHHLQDICNHFKNLVHLDISTAGNTTLTRT